MTPLPPADWVGEYDAWIHAIGRRLGIDVPPPRGIESYERELADVIAEAQRRLPGIRKRFQDGLGELRLGLKIGLPTRDGGKEFVWVSPLEWRGDGAVSCRLESDPHDCDGFSQGQQLTIAESDIADYVIGSETTGVVDPGLSHRIAENYGLIVS